MTTTLPEEYLNTALVALDAARAVTRQYFRSNLAVDSKQDRSPVTVADRETEDVMREIILSNHPEHGFFGEEGGDQSGNKEWRWVIDPIDGTTSFATGKPTFGTLISLLQDDQAMLGIIDHSILDERWVGIHGQETIYNGTPVSTSDSATLDLATIYTTTLDMVSGDSFAQYSRLSKQCKFRAFGGDCYSYGLLASGFTDLVCEADLKPYDFLALVPVVEGAGGIITDWQGNTLTLESGDQVLASANQALHDLALAELNR